MTDRIPLEYVEGAEEVTVWLWPQDPQPVTMQVSFEKWDALLEKAGDEDLEEFIGRIVAQDLPERLSS